MSDLNMRNVPVEQLEAILADYRVCRDCNTCKANFGGWRCGYVYDKTAKELKRLKKTEGTA